jgi:uncharacterized protein (TIGR02145 family)
MKTMKRLFMMMMFSGAGYYCAAQSVQVLTVPSGASYSVPNAVPATSPATYQWLENGAVIPGATGESYTNVLGKRLPGKYEYVRQANTPSCGGEWMSSNVFTVLVTVRSEFDDFNPTGLEPVGTEWTLTDDRDGKVYRVVKMPDNKVWMAQNLNFTKDLVANAASNVANGVPFTSTANGVPAIGSYWCPPQFPEGTAPTASGDESACNTYGALYTWETAMMVDGRCADEALTNCGTVTWDETWVSSNTYSTGAPGATANADKNNARGAVVAKGGGRGICPKTWHVPTDREWALMSDKVEGDGNGTVFVDQTGTGWLGSNAGLKLKSAATYSATTDDGKGAWKTNAGTIGTNTTAFGAVPAGYRNNNGSQFTNRGIDVNYWSASVVSSSYAWRRYLFYNEARVYRHGNGRSHGLSVRCVKD